MACFFFFFFSDTATTEIYTLSLHDALPILDYPPEDVEYQIVKKHVKNPAESDILLGIKLANTLRQASAVEELYYSPSIRETIAFAKLLEGGVSAKQAAKIVFGNVYTQWGNVEFQKVNDIITSMFGS